MNRYDDTLSYLRLVTQPSSIADEDLLGWAEATDALTFFRANTYGDVVLEVGFSHFVTCSVLVPLDLLTDDYLDDLMLGILRPSDGWTSSVGRDRETNEPWGFVQNPVSVNSSEKIKAGEKVVFLRNFAGREPRLPYIELNQKIAHVVDAHWLESRSAYSCIDQNGDIADIVRFHSSPEGHLTTIDAASLDHYLFASN